MWLLDTNVISELRKPKPSSSVLAWIETQKFESLITSVVCMSEIVSGIRAQSNTAMQNSLNDWHVGIVQPMFEGRTIQLSQSIVITWLGLIRDLHGQRRSAPPADLLIAATCLEMNVPVVTRDVYPFTEVGVPTLNPFTGERFNGA
jgi:toxin FitB